MNINKHVDKFSKILIILSILIFVFMIYLYIRYPFIRIDEDYTWGMVQLPLNDMISVTALDVHSPLFYLIIMGLIKIIPFNISLIYIMKFASIIPYIIILILSLTKIRKDYGIFTSGLFLFTISAMSMFFRFFIIARSYSWSVLGLILVFIVLKDLLEEPSLKLWLSFSIFSVLCAYLHYFSAISAVLINLMLFIYLMIENRLEIRNFFISVILGIILYLPWMFTLLNQLSAVKKSYWIEPVSLISILKCFSFFLTTFTNHYIQIISVVLLFVFLVLILKQYLLSKDTINLYVLMGFFTFIGTIIFGVIFSVLFKPILFHTYLLPSIAVLWLSLSIFIPKMNSKWIIIVVTLLILVEGGANIYNETNSLFSEYDTALKEQNILNSINNNNSIVLFVSDNRFIRTYWALDNVYEIYTSVNLNNKTYTVNNSNFNANYTTFNLPRDLTNFTEKNIYLIVPNSVNTSDIHKEKIGTVTNSNIYKISLV